MLLLFFTPADQDGYYYRYRGLFLFLKMTRIKRQGDDKTWPGQKGLKAEPRLEPDFVWFSSLYSVHFARAHPLARIQELPWSCLQTQNPGQGSLSDLKEEIEQTSLCLESKCPFPTFIGVRWETCFPLPSPRVWPILLFQPHLGGPGQPGAAKQTGVGGRDGILSWPRWDHTSFKMQIDTWRSKVPQLIPWAGGEN